MGRFYHSSDVIIKRVRRTNINLSKSIFDIIYDDIGIAL